ncbi:Protein NEDD1 [Trichoplax sp. H2]|uniref:Uncharacterized protein n=1 Tax=Trichoplax adhaerens TaxID=10228 RepID=B3SD89_TRIAD|nr:hypothetical protein TRIADDRAFT_62246 [Trichoplax adhaerens]EDV19299.1 hypothetical protein TRIADDRAFT_62246 [Trichoplax adhaerens]RDD40579.1 Protein NEDD1 [Trichoplax sp. H2]|eukprot:XP_002118223.1 hypothetical protein TRIADDRAFT_62246 [Trichoplax adhaerens]
MADNSKLASCGEDIKIWSGIDMQLLHSYNPHSNDTITGLAWGHNNHVMCSTASESNRIIISSMRGSPVKLIELEAEGQVNCAAFNSNSRYVVVGSQSAEVSIFDLKSRSIQKVFKSHTDPITCVSFSNRDQYIASGAINGHVRIDNVTTSQSSSPLIAENCQAIRALQYSHFRTSLLGVASDSGEINLWDINSMKLWWSSTDAHFAPATDLSFSTVNDMLLATVGLDKRIVLSDVKSKKVVKVIEADGPLSTIDFNTDGATLAVGTSRGKIILFDLRTGSVPLRSANAHSSRVNKLYFQNQFVKELNSGRPAKQVNINKAPSLQHPVQSSTPAVASLSMSNQSRKVSGEVNTAPTTGRSDLFSPVREVFGDTSTDVNVSNNSQFNRLQQFGPGIFSPVNSNTIVTTQSTDRDTFEEYRAANTGESTIKQERSLEEIKKRYEEIQRNADNTEALNSNLNNSPHPRIGHAKVRSNSRSLPEEDVISPESSKNKQTIAAGSLTRSVSSNSIKTMQSITDNTTSDVKPIPDGDDSPKALFRKQAWTEGDEKIENVEFPIVTAIEPPKQPDKASAFQKPNDTETIQPFQTEFIKNMIDDSIEEMREAVHRDIANMHFEMLRQFQLQLDEMKRSIKEASVNEELLAEVERLRTENEMLKNKH